MTLISMVSAKGSPGVSTTLLACALTWSAPVLLAECDPAGGALLSGYLSRYELPADRGILPLAGAALRGIAPQELAGQLIDLDGDKRERMALPGLADPAQSASLEPAWLALGMFFASLGPVVLADCGRLAAPHPPLALLRQSDLVLLAVRPRSLRTLSPAVPAIAALRRELAEANVPMGLVLVGGGSSGREVARHLMAPVVGEVAWDPKTAAALCGQGRGRRRGPLMRTASGLRERAAAAIAAHAGQTTVPQPAAR
ncbi:hypothetical protein [Hamadaea tsunoensis]|uniref:hypothetical protein n=1 Tax=Hamadaea tsunoensis TaxID=53368 RepID=UPI00041533C9|nr:hypothetical protein [Hamadaea tsunoensis]